jgi:hypothetical protein
MLGDVNFSAHWFQFFKCVFVFTYGGNHAKASIIEALALSRRHAAAGLTGVDPSLPLLKNKGRRFSRIKEVRLKASGIDRSSSEQNLRKTTIEVSIASTHIIS